MRYLLFVFFVAMLYSCQEKDISFELTNPTKFKRTDEPVFIDLNKLPDNFNDSTYAVFSVEKEIPFQIIDRNGNGEKDFMFLLVDFDPEEIINLKVKPVESRHPQKVRANVRFGSRKPPYIEITGVKRLTTSDTVKASNLFLMEGPAWENDRVAFRNYYDQRNGIDIFGKRTEKMVLDSVGIDGTNYHALSDWGMDILHVGNSLGAGAIAIQVGDTIYPIRNPQNSSYALLNDGPLYASLKLVHKGFKILNRTYDIEHILSIYGGSFYYTSTVSVIGLKGDEKLVSGIVNLHSEKLYKENKYNQKIFATYDTQAEDHKMLGLAMLIDDNDFDSIVKDSFPAKGIEDTYMVRLNFDKDNSSDYCFYACWETGFSSFRNMSYFSTFLERNAERKNKPILLSFH